VENGMDNDKMLIDNQVEKPQEERRRSDHLKEVIHLTTMERNEAMAKKRNLEGIIKRPGTIAEIDNQVLHVLAKDMGVLVKDSNFDSFDMLKELENARNCLHMKNLKKIVSINCAKIVKFVPSEDQIINIVSSNEESDLKEMLNQQSKEKSKFGKKKKNQFLPRGRKQDQEDPDLPDSRNPKISVKLKKGKNKRKMIIQGLFWNCRGLKKKGVSTFLKNLIHDYKFHFIGL
jgi:hypothetical protein